MVLSGGIALIWTDPAAGRRLELAGGLPADGAADAGRRRAVGAFALPRLPHAQAPHGVARNDLLGFVAVLAAVAWASCSPTASVCRIAGVLLGAAARRRAAPALQAKWIDLCALLLGIAFTLPLAAWAAQAREFRDPARRPALATSARRCGRVPALHRAVQARRRLRRLADDAVPAARAWASLGRGRRRQQDHRPVADDRRCAARRRADAQARAVARVAVVRRAADGEQPRLLVAGGRRQGRCCRA